MADEILLSDIVDLTGIEGDIDKVLAYINKVDKAIQDINKNPINLGKIAGLNELKTATDQLTQSFNQLNTAISGISKNNASKVFQDHSKHVHESTAATQENTVAQKENLTWTQFVGQRMGQYMKTYGDHASAIRKISEEWKEYKATGQSVVQTSNVIASAQQKEIAGVSEKETVLTGLNEKYLQATILSKNLADQFGAESVQAKNAARTAAELKEQIDQLNATQPAATTPNISAYEALKKETKEAEINAKNLAAQFGIDSKEALEAAASYEVLREKLAQVNSVTKAIKPTAQATPFDPNSVPYTNNASALDDEARAANVTTEAVTDLEREEASAANEATAWGNAQLEANGVIKEQTEVVPEMVGALDEYTGSISQNIQAQIENNAALVKNRSEQKLLGKEIASAGGATDAQTASLITLKQEELLLVDANKAVGQTIRNQVKDFASAEGSINAMRSQLALLQQQYESFSVIEKASPVGQNLKAQIDVLDPALKKAEEGIGKAQRSVGGYGNAITKSLGGAFGYLRQIAYILPGIGIAGILSAAIDPAVELVSSMFDLDEGIKRDKSSLGELKENLAQFNDEVKRGAEDLELYFRYLDRLKDDSKIKIEVDNINVNPITKLSNELGSLQLEVSAVQQKFIEAEKDFEKTSLDAGDLQNAFLNHASKEAVDAYFSGTIESVKEGLSKTDKVLYDGFIKANEAYTKSSERFSDIFVLRQAAIERIKQKTKEISKENADEERQITKDNVIAVEEIIKAKNNAILSDERSSLNDRLNAIKSNYAAERSIILANENFVLSDPTKSSADKNAAKKQASTELNKAEISANQNRFKTSEEFRIREVKADADYHNSLLKDDEAFQNELVSNTIGSIETRKTALQNYVADQIALSKSNFSLQLQQSGFSSEEAKQFIETGKYKIANKKITDDELLAMARQYESSLLGIARDSEKRQTEIIQQEIEKQDKLRQEGIDRIETIYSSRQLNTSSQYEDDVIALNKANEQKIISNEKYDRKRRKLDEKYRIDTLSNTIDELEDELSAYDGASQRFTAADIKLNSDRDSLRQLEKTKNNGALIERLENEISIDELDYKSAKDLVDKKIALLKKLKEAEQGVSEEKKKANDDEKKDSGVTADYILGRTTEVVSQIKSLYDELSDARIQQYEAEKDALENRYQREIDLINQAYVNTVDRDRALAAAKARNAAQKKQLDDKEKQENIKKARFDKAAAIFSIIINTAKAIVADLGNPFKIAFDAAIGAAELAVAIAAPLPKYFRGKNLDAFTDNYEGPALINDGGKKEAIIRQDGSVELPQKMNTVQWVGAKDIVLPDANMLAWNATKSAAGLNYVTVSNSDDQLRSDLRQGFGNVVKAIKNQPKQKSPNSRDAIIRAWISSDRPWKDFSR